MVLGVNTWEASRVGLTLRNGYALGLAPGTDRIVTDIAGWHKGAAFRRTKTDRLNRHGIFSENGYREARYPSVSGLYSAPDAATAEAWIDELNDLCGEGQAGVLAVDSAGLGRRWAEVYVIGVDVTWRGGPDVLFTVDFEAPDPRKYGDAVTAGPTPPASDPTGLVWDLFTGPLSSTVARVNQADNPIPSSAAGWSTTSGYVKTWEASRFGRPAALITRAATGPGVYIWYGRNAGTLGTLGGSPTIANGLKPVGAGQTVYASMDMGTTSAAAKAGLTLRWYDVNGTALSTTPGPTVPVTTGVNGWQTFTVTGAAPAGARYYYLENYVQLNTGNTVGGELAWGSRVYMSTTPGAYFTGSTPASAAGVYSWAGAVGASESYESLFTGGAGILDFGTGGSPGTVTVQNVGKADTPLRLTVKAGSAPIVDGFTITELETGRRLIYRYEIPAGQYIIFNSWNGTALLNGKDDRKAGLSRSEWPVLPGGVVRTYLFECTSVAATLTIEAAPAWW